MSVIEQSSVYLPNKVNNYKCRTVNVDCEVPRPMNNSQTTKDELYPELQKVKQNQSKEFNILLEACLELDQEVQEELASNLEKQIQEKGEAN